MKKFFVVIGVVGKTLTGIWKVYMGFLNFAVKLALLFWTGLVLYFIINPALIFHARVGDEVSSSIISYVSDLSRSTVKVEMYGKGHELLFEEAYQGFPFDFLGGWRVWTDPSTGDIAQENDSDAESFGPTYKLVQEIYVRHLRVPNSASEPWFSKPRLFMRLGKNGMEYVKPDLPNDQSLMIARPRLVK